VSAPRTRSRLFKGLVLAALHLLIVSSLGAKLLYDRGTRPSVWVETAPYDPEMPIRGRYVSLMLVVDAPEFAPPSADSSQTIWGGVRLQVERERLVARRDPGREDWSGSSIRFQERDGAWVTVLSEPVAFFIPEHVEDPSRRAEGETLMVEVTIPRRGPPRPIRLGSRRDGVITPLPLD